METISIDGTEKMPSVNFNPETGVIELKGKSVGENAVQFYRPIMDWLEAYSKMPQKNTTVHLSLEYFNCSSSKCLLEVFKKLKVVVDAGNHVEINWYVNEDDEDMLEAGEDYESIVKIPFKFIET